MSTFCHSIHLNSTGNYGRRCQAPLRGLEKRYNHLTANLPRNLPEKKNLKSVKNWQNYGHESGAPFFGAPCIPSDRSSCSPILVSISVFLLFLGFLFSTFFPGMRGQEEWGRGRGRGPNFFSRPRPRPQCIRPRPDTLENKSVCMSTLLAFRT